MGTLAACCAGTEEYEQASACGLDSGSLPSSYAAFDPVTTGPKTVKSGISPDQYARIQEWARQEKEAPLKGMTNGLKKLLEAKNFRPSGCACTKGFLLDTCTKPSGFFSSGTCKPNDEGHLERWHTPCYVCKPRRRLARNYDHLTTMIGNVGNNVRSDVAAQRSAAIQRVMQKITRDMRRKPTAYELAKFVKSEFGKSNIEGGFTTAEAFEYLKDFEPSSRRRLGKLNLGQGFKLQIDLTNLVTRMNQIKADMKANPAANVRNDPREAEVQRLEASIADIKTQLHLNETQQAGRRRLCKHTSWFGGDCKNCKRNAEIVKKAEELRKRNAHWTPPKTDDKHNAKLQQRLNKKL